MPKKLKIIFLDLDDIKNPQLGSGQARATLEVGQRFVEKGHEVLVISSRYPGYKDRTENGIIYKHIGVGTKWLLVNNAIYILTLPFVVRKLTGDIIIDCFTAPISALFTPLFTKIPVVALPTVFAAEYFSKKFHLPFTWFEKMGCRLYKYFMPYLKTDEEKMRSYNRKVVSRTIPQGISDEYFLLKQKKPKHILFLGRLDIAQKGIDLLLEAYAKVATKIPLPLVIAGHGQDESKIRKIITTLGLTKKVQLVGSAYGEKKKQLLAEALFVAFPSRYDNLPLFSLEALASGLPLVTFSIPEFYWLKPQFALQAKEFDTTEYGELLLKASRSKEISAMRNSARQYARNFSWDKVTSQMLSFFTYIHNQEQPI